MENGRSDKPPRPRTMFVCYLSPKTSSLILSSKTIIFSASFLTNKLQRKIRSANSKLEFTNESVSFSSIMPQFDSVLFCPLSNLKFA